MGGSEPSTDIYSELMPEIVKKYTAMRKFARRWMHKANIKRRHTTGLDIATIIKKQRMSWEPTVRLRETVAMQNIVPTMTNEQYEREIALKSHSATSVFQEISSNRNEQKITDSLKSVLPPLEAVVASEESSKLTKRRKILKSKQSATSDIDESAKRRRTGKRRGRARRRSSRKSQQSVTSDGPKKGQRKRKGRRKSIKSLDSGGQDMKQSRRGHSVRKGRKRQSKEKSKASQISQEPESRAGTVQSIVDEKSAKENLLFEMNLQQQSVPVQMKKASVNEKTALDKFRRKSVEFDKSQSDTNCQFHALEEYWGVPLRTDCTLDKLERLNSILDELIVEEEKKPSPPLKHMLSSRNVVRKPSKREMRDLEKLLVLLKECKKCQKKQEKAKAAERDFAVLCKKEHDDAIKNAAGLPDYFPEDSDFSVMCSCNSVS
ncbi:uncharacterized protein LOC109579215 [Bactrocera dorsalis]|uniref:Uncharacterized protein LOC109579215 n=1 Tax=Bactrocera dorsalis TaxID=27457 RepID=A0A6J0RIL9_BACDO|nr:uncharacterized protein LOC109579215 [Bactrocera dorsalis]